MYVRIAVSACRDMSRFFLLRAIYLRHALKAKVAYQIFLLVVWHLWLLFLLPSDLITRT